MSNQQERLQALSAAVTPYSQELAQRAQNEGGLPTDEVGEISVEYLQVLNEISFPLGFLFYIFYRKEGHFEVYLEDLQADTANLHKKNPNGGEFVQKKILSAPAALSHLLCCGIVGYIEQPK